MDRVGCPPFNKYQQYDRIPWKLKVCAEFRGKSGKVFSDDAIRAKWRRIAEVGPENFLSTFQSPGNHASAVVQNIPQDEAVDEMQNVGQESAPEEIGEEKESVPSRSNADAQRPTNLETLSLRMEAAGSATVMADQPDSLEAGDADAAISDVHNIQD